MLEKLLSFGKKRRGVAKVMGLIIAIIFTAVLSPLAIYLTNQVINVIPQPTNPQLSSAYNNTVSNVKFSFSLAHIEPILSVFALILILLLGFLYTRQK